MENKIVYCGQVIAEVAEVDEPVFSENNQVIVVGKILTEFEYSHKKYYKIAIAGEDEKFLWVMIHQDLAVWKQMQQPKLKNMYAKIAGEFLARNNINPNIYAQSLDLLQETEPEFANICLLRGKILQIDIQGKCAELLLKVRNDNGMVNFIQCKALKNKAKYAKTKLQVGMEVEILGEIERERVMVNDKEKIRVPKINIKKMRKVCLK